MVGVNQGGLRGGDTDEIIRQFKAQTRVTFPLGVDVNKTFDTYSADENGISPFPLDVIVGKDGTIEYLAREFHPDEMKAVLDRLLNEPNR